MIISVSQLNNYIRGLFDMDNVLQDISICGEVTNLKRARDGWYFSLKDQDSAIDCFCYANSAVPVQGAMSVAEGTVNFFAKNGRVSFFARKLTVTDKSGQAYEAFLKLKEKLQAEGLFDVERKKPVPHCCTKIGVVTSATGAVIHDIQNVVFRRQPFANILLYPVKVQGVGADFEIAQGVLYFSNTDVDVVIVGRGGGSNEDLSQFNSEIVARAVASCTKPVVSAVGHGVDFTICDFVADKRAVTPSEAAEFVTIDSNLAKTKIAILLGKIHSVAQAKIQERSDLAKYSLRHIFSHVEHKLSNAKNDVLQNLQRCHNATQQKLQNNKSRLDKTTAVISASNPLAVLKRGYSAVTADGKRISTVSQLAVGQKISVAFCDGVATATVNSLEEK